MNKSWRLAMSENSNSSGGKAGGGGIGFVGLLTIVFIVLKLTGVINWSWVWVLSPIWISAILGIVIIAIVFIVTFFIYNKWKK
jgi:hypothetical protein